MSVIAHVKDEKSIYCRQCLDLLMVLKDTYLAGSRLQESDIDQTKGQAPWVDGMLMICKKCNYPFADLVPYESR